jgi:hypothetical protein
MNSSFSMTKQDSKKLFLNYQLTLPRKLLGFSLDRMVKCMMKFDSLKEQGKAVGQQLEGKPDPGRRCMVLPEQHHYEDHRVSACSYKSHGKSMQSHYVTDSYCWTPQYRYSKKSPSSSSIRAYLIPRPRCTRPLGYPTHQTSSLYPTPLYP